MGASGYFIAPRLHFEKVIDELIFYYLLRRANYRDNGDCKRGQAIVSQTEIARELGMSKWQIKRVFDRLRALGYITWEAKPLNQGLVVTIVGYDDMQKLDFSATQAQHERNTGATQSATRDEPAIPDVTRDFGQENNSNATQVATTAQHVRNTGATEIKELKELKELKNVYNVDVNIDVVDQEMEEDDVRKVEEHFLRRRGRGLMLSPLDEMEIRKLLEEGIPVDVILRGIDRAFDQYQPKYQGDGISSFRYCVPVIRGLWAELNRPKPTGTIIRSRRGGRRYVKRDYENMVEQLREALAQRKPKPASAYLPDMWGNAAAGSGAQAAVDGQVGLL